MKCNPPIFLWFSRDHVSSTSVRFHYPPLLSGIPPGPYLIETVTRVSKRQYRIEVPFGCIFVTRQTRCTRHVRVRKEGATRMKKDTVTERQHTNSFTRVGLKSRVNKRLSHSDDTWKGSWFHGLDKQCDRPSDFHTRTYFAELTTSLIHIIMSWTNGLKNKKYMWGPLSLIPTRAKPSFKRLFYANVSWIIVKEKGGIIELWERVLLNLFSS